MNLRWLLLDYADPALPLSCRQRLKILLRPYGDEIVPQSVRRSRYLCLALMVLPIFCGSGVLFMLQISAHPPSSLPVLYFLYAAGTWTWGCLVYGVFGRPEYYHRVRLEGFDVCLGCGYWLRELRDEILNCPECGEKREEMPKPEQPQMDTGEQGS